MHSTYYLLYNDLEQRLAGVPCADIKHQNSPGMSTVNDYVSLESCPLCFCSLCASSAQPGPAQPLHSSAESHSASLCCLSKIYDIILKVEHGAGIQT